MKNHGEGCPPGPYAQSVIQKRKNDLISNCALIRMDPLCNVNENEMVTRWGQRCHATHGRLLSFLQSFGAKIPPVCDDISESVPN